MNSKKNKRNIREVVEGRSLDMPKNTKKKKIDITNENANSENKTKKRKSDTDSEIPLKKAKKKTRVQESKNLPLSSDNIENELATKNSKKNGPVSVMKPIKEESSVQEGTTNNIEAPKKGKKKKKKSETEEVLSNNLDIGVSTSKVQKTDVCEANIESLDNETNECKVLHHEGNIIDIKDAKLNEDNEKVVTISIRDIEGVDSDWDEIDLLKQLERRIEKKEPPKERKVSIEWPDGDLEELIDRMQTDLPENDIKPFRKRAEILEWDKIAFKNYTPDDCKKTWGLLLKKIRKYRVLKEVLQDAKTWVTTPKIKKKPTKIPRHPDMPRRPLSAYFIYYLKKKDSLQVDQTGMDVTELAKLCSQKFKLLPPEKRAKYEKIANKNKEEYDQKMKEFYEIHPELKTEKEPRPRRPSRPARPVRPPKPPKPVIEKPPPKPAKEKLPKRPLPAFQYYHQAEALKEQVEDKVAFKELCKERWKQMPDDKKIEWISYAETENFKYEEEMKEYIKNHPEFIQTSQTKPQLTKEELLVKERLSGKPSKPPVSAYNLFARIHLHSEDIKLVPVKERLMHVCNQWKECSDEDKKYYKELFDQTIKKHNEDYAAYLQSLTEEERQIELQKNVPKRRKSEDEKVKKDSKAKKPKKKSSETAPERKRAPRASTAPKPNSSASKTNSVPGTNSVPKANSAPKKSENKLRTLVEPEQPPISPFRYFASTYSGEESPAIAWKTLSPEEKKRYEDELVEKKKAYILDFEKFLKSMTKEELENFSNSRKKLNNQKVPEEEEDDEQSSDQSDSNEESADDEEEED